MYGLALEGGRSEGAYHMGAIKAFRESGYEIGGITGTSVGAVNGAIVAQGDFEKGYELWENLDPTQLFDIEKEEYEKNHFLHQNLLHETALKILGHK